MSFFIRATPYKPQANLLKRGPKILLHLRYVVDGRILSILAQADLKNIEPLIFYKHILRKVLKMTLLLKRGANLAIFLERLDRLS